MKIKRTVKEHYLGCPFKEAGETETIGQEKMETIIRGTRLGFIDPNEWGVRAALSQLQRTGKLETFYATYELLEA